MGHERHFPGAPRFFGRKISKLQSKISKAVMSKLCATKKNTNRMLLVCREQKKVWYSLHLSRGVAKPRSPRFLGRQIEKKIYTNHNQKKKGHEEKGRKQQIFLEKGENFAFGPGRRIPQIRPCLLFNEKLLSIKFAIQFNSLTSFNIPVKNYFIIKITPNSLQSLFKNEKL